ncbi:hypothetical protein DFP73DRAFT_586723 [Morchella snyderi]|nr:hypothetical protein DFP73DRAFT_586723 [Morchella snyderi]
MEDLLTYDQPLNLTDPDIVNGLLNGPSASSTREEHDAALNQYIDFSNHAAQVFDIEFWLSWGFEPPDWTEPTANDGSRFGYPLATPTTTNPPKHEAQNFQQESSGSSVYATRNGRFDLVVGSEPGPSQLPARQSQYNSTEQHNNSHSSYTELPNNESPLVSSNPVFMTPPPEPNENGEGRKGEEALPVNNNPVPAGSMIGAMFRCTHPECKRTKGFTRKHNLTQHRRQVHKEPIPIVRYRWGTQPEGNSGRRTQRRRGETANTPSSWITSIWSLHDGPPRAPEGRGKEKQSC